MRTIHEITQYYRLSGNDRGERVCRTRTGNDERKVGEAFGNDHPVYVEIGMGKGRFLMDMARLYPEINFIGIEKYSSVLLRAVQKLEEEELPNVRLIRMDAEDLETFSRRESWIAFT